jgi:hypothetical protein
MSTIIGVQDNILGRLTSQNTLNKLLQFETEHANSYTAFEMLTDLRKGIWSELTTKQAIDIYRRNLQKAFVDRLIRTITPETSSTGAASPITSSFARNSDAISIAKAQLRTLQSEIRAAIPLVKDAVSKAHLQDVNDRITNALDPKK